MIRLLTLPVVVLAAYAASPFVSLYEMAQAARTGNVQALCADVDWDSVRAGLRQDIAEGITGAPAPAATNAAAGDDLPAFGSGFVSNMAANVVDRNVNAQHLAETIGALQAAGARTPGAAIRHAYFDGPTEFMVELAAPGEAATAAPIRLRLDLVAAHGGLHWKVTRAWIPQNVLAQTETHLS